MTYNNVVVDDGRGVRVVILNVIFSFHHENKVMYDKDEDDIDLVREIHKQIKSNENPCKTLRQLLNKWNGENATLYIDNNIIKCINKK